MGISRKLVGVEISGDPLGMNFTPWPTHTDGAPVGKVTTALWSPRLEKNIGYAWMPIERAADGNRVSVTTPDGEREATVVPMPFIDPEKSIPKAKVSAGEVGPR
jgi:aminomethyltransferase